MKKIQGKTADGKFKLTEIVRLLSDLAGVNVTAGSRHLLVARFSGVPAAGFPGSCAIAKSTSYDRHVVPWVKKITGYDKKIIHDAFNGGYWPE